MPDSKRRTGQRAGLTVMTIETPQIMKVMTVSPSSPTLLPRGVARQHRVSTESQLSPAHKTHCHLDEFALSCRFRRPATGMPEKLIYGSFLTLKEAAEYLKVNELSVY